MINNKKGFTLIELLVVISIIMILASLAVPQLGKARAKARKAQTIANLKAIGSGLMMFADSSPDGSFPANLEALYPGFIGDYKTFDNPRTAGTVTPSNGTLAANSTNGEYLYEAGFNDSANGNQVIVKEPAAVTGSDPDGEVCILLVSGTARSVAPAEVGQNANYIWSGSGGN